MRHRSSKLPLVPALVAAVLAVALLAVLPRAVTAGDDAAPPPVAPAPSPSPAPVAPAAPSASPAPSPGPSPSASPSPTPPLPRIVRTVCTDHICGNCDGKCHKNSGHVAVDKKGHCACTPTAGGPLDQATRQAYEKNQPQ